MYFWGEQVGLCRKCQQVRSAAASFPGLHSTWLHRHQGRPGRLKTPEVGHLGRSQPALPLLLLQEAGPLPTSKTCANRITFYTAITVEEFEVEKFKFGWAKIEISKYVSELMKAVYFYVHK